MSGPPAISNAMGGISVEPPEWILEVDRLVYLPGNCKALVKGSGAIVRGSVRLRVDETGRVDVRGIFQSAGFPCGDAVLQRIAGDLWYRWLPNDEFPAPVELIQPLVVRGDDGAVAPLHDRALDTADPSRVAPPSAFARATAKCLNCRRMILPCILASAGCLIRVPPAPPPPPAP